MSGANGPRTDLGLSGASGALDGVVIADFSRVLAGPLATMLLADMGADVIKVERPEVGDDTRAWGPPFVGADSTYYLAVNRNKRSVVLDLASEDGRQAALALIDRADALVENFSVGTMERLGLGWEAMHERNPGLVYCSISGFGRQEGGRLPGYDFLVQAMGGLMSITGEAEGEPVKAGVAVVDVIAGLHATIGLLAALRARERTGAGQRVDVNLLSSLLSGLVNQASSYVTAGVVPTRQGNRHPSIAPYETLQAADGRLALAVGNDRQFTALCAELGRPSLAADPRFATNAARVTHCEELVAELSDALAADTVEGWTRRLGAGGVPCGPVNDLGQAFGLAEELGLQPIQYVPDGEGPGVAQVSNPVTLSRTPVSYRRPPPRLGAHTDELLSWLSTSVSSRADEEGGWSGAQ